MTTSQMSPGKEIKETETETGTNSKEKREKKIDHDLEDTFPASDPPTHY
jgi:hypothetical protein